MLLVHVPLQSFLRFAYNFRSVHAASLLVAYTVDYKEDEIYTVFVIDLEIGEYVGQPLEGFTSDIEWAGDDNLVYITMDSVLRPDKVCGLLFLFLHEVFPSLC